MRCLLPVAAFLVLGFSLLGSVGNFCGRARIVAAFLHRGSASWGQFFNVQMTFVPLPLKLRPKTPMSIAMVQVRHPFRL